MEPIWLKSYPAGRNPHPVIPAISVADMLRSACATFANREAYWSAGVAMSFAELQSNALKVTSWLQQQGLRKGDRVAIMLPNVLPFPVCVFGALLGGFAVVNVNPQYTPRELTHQLRDSGAKILFAWEAALPAVEKSLPDLELSHVVAVAATDPVSERPTENQPKDTRTGRKDESHPHRITFREVMLKGGEAPSSPADVSPDDIAFLQYTGGTTGLSKGAVILHRNVVSHTIQRAVWNKDVTEPRSLVLFPFYHAAALHGAFVMLQRGGSCALVANPRDVDRLVQLLSSRRFTHMGAVNTLYNALLNHPKIRDVDFSSFVAFGAGGAATQQTVADRWHALTGRPLIEAYGMSEATCTITLSDPDAPAFDGTAGLPLPHTELSVRDENGAEVALGEMGEICVRGPQVMAGYWNRPEETANAMTADGFLRTGDIGSMDARGRIRISDRKKDMILVSGFNVFPNEIEGVLATHPKVLEAAVIGVPDEHSSEVPVAFVVRRDEALTSGELIAFCRERLTAYKCPKRIEFREALPKTAVGKILRKTLRDEYRLQSARD